MNHDAPAHSSPHHVTSLPVLFGTFAALVVLTIVTVAQARVEGIELGKFEIAVTLAIATLKAGLVAMVFMQLIYDKPFNRVVILSTLVFVALFLSFTIMDTAEYMPDIRNFTLDNPNVE